MSDSRLSESRPGAVLRAAREAQGYRVREVADALNLPLHIVEAIEADDSEKLPAYVFTRGYVRAYAKLLEIEPDPLVAALAMEQGAVEEEPVVLQPDRAKPVVMLIGAGVLALVVILGLVMWLASDGENIDPEPLSEPPVATPSLAIEPRPGMVRSEPTDAVGANSDIEVNELGSDEAGTAVPAAGVDSPALQPLVTASEAPNSEPAAPAPQAAQAAESDTSTDVRFLNEGSQRLQIEFSDECWVEIRDAQDNMLYANLGQPGQTWSFSGQGPFQLLLGYAPGAMLYFNGEVVALAPHTRNNVATLVLGQ